MSSELNFEELEAKYQKEHGTEEYKGAQDYARRMSMKELDEYTKKRRQAGITSDSLLKMGQEALAYSREYQEIADGKRKPEFRKKPVAIAPKNN